MTLETAAKTWKNMGMQSAFAMSGYLRQFTAQVLLIVFVCLGLIPTGFMPAFSSNGTATITICAGTDQKDITVDDQGQPTHSPSGKLCQFSLNTGTTPTVQPMLNHAPIIQTIALDPFVAPRHLRVYINHLNAPRAPPAA